MNNLEPSLWSARPVPKIVWDFDLKHFVFSGSILFIFVLYMTYRAWSSDIFIPFFLFFCAPALLLSIIAIMSPIILLFRLYFTTYYLTAEEAIIVEDYLLFNVKYTYSIYEVKFIKIVSSNNTKSIIWGMQHHWWNLKDYKSDFAFYNVSDESFLLIKEFIPNEKFKH